TVLPYIIEMMKGWHATCQLSTQRSTEALRRWTRQGRFAGDGRQAAQAAVSSRNCRHAGAARTVSGLEAASTQRRPGRVLEPFCHWKLAVDFPVRPRDEYCQRH